MMQRDSQSEFFQILNKINTTHRYLPTMKKKYSRRTFVRGGLLAGASLALTPIWLPGCAESSSSAKGDQAEGENMGAAMSQAGEMFFSISLAQWSLHKMIRAGELDNLDFPAFAKNEFDIHAVEYVNQFFADKARDEAYLSELKKRCEDEGVTSVLIMVDHEGNLGSTNQADLDQAVENHHQWVEAAKFLGCHSIRVNAYGEGTREDVQQAAIEGLSRVGEYAAPHGIGVIVENHGSYSSDGTWLSEVMRQVNRDNVGTLPDFGNFCIERKPGDWTECLEEYDRYQGTKDLMPFAKGVSAKSHDFDQNGNEVHSDYTRLLTIVKEAGYTGHIGIEYEGSELSEVEGIKKTKTLLERVGKEIS